MSEWIDFFVYAALIVGFWFVLPTANLRFTLPMLADRNPEWFAANPQVVNKLASSRWFIRTCYAYGALGLSLLLSFQLGFWPRALTPPAPGDRWEVLKDINAAVMIVGLVYWFACIGLFTAWTRKNVPSAERRQATLEPRSIDDFIPRWLRFLAYVLAGLNLAAWLIVGLLQLYSTPIFWPRLVMMAGLSAFFIFMTNVGVNRRPHAMDRIFGPGYRRSELRSGFAMQFLPPAIGTVRLYEEVTGTTLVDVNRASHVGIALFIVVALLRFSLYSRTRQDPGEVPPSHSAKSAAAFLFCAMTLLLPVCSWAQTPAAATAAPRDAEILKILAERVDTHRQSVGIVVGVVEPSGRRVVAYGQRAKGEPAPVDADSVFEIGSVTKAFTSLLLADAVRRGEVALTDPVAKYLPPQVKMPERNGRTITLQDLATHTSGLPREPTNLQPKDPSNPFADYSVDQLYRFLSGYQLTRDIASEFEYSNLGAGLLGHVLALRAGTNYETLVRTRITEPLGMKRTAVTMSSEMRGHLAVGHNLVLEPVANWDSPTLAGAGAVESTANDMLTFLAAALGQGSSPLQPAFAAMTATRRPTASPAVDVGLGWAILKANETEVIWSNGRTGGYRTWAGYEPRSRTGVVVLANTDGSVEPDDIGLHLLNPRFALRQTFPSPPKPRTETKVAASLFDRYVGRYQFAPAVLLTVTRDGDRFFAQLTDQPPFQVFAESEKDYFVKTVDAQLTFETDAQNKTTAVVLHQNGVDQRALKVEGEPTVPND